MDIIIIYQNDEQIEGLTVTPAQTDGTDKMCLCRCETAPEGVEVLGTYDEIFADEDKYARYCQLYPQTYTQVGEEGDEVTVERTEKRFGVFA